MSNYHKYANGLDNFMFLNEAGDAIGINANGDHNDWGKIDFQTHSPFFMWCSG